MHRNPRIPLHCEADRGSRRQVAIPCLLFRSARRRRRFFRVFSAKLGGNTVKNTFINHINNSFSSENLVLIPNNSQDPHQNKVDQTSDVTYADLYLFWQQTTFHHRNSVKDSTIEIVWWQTFFFMWYISRYLSLQSSPPGCLQCEEIAAAEITNPNSCVSVTTFPNKFQIIQKRCYFSGVSYFHDTLRKIRW